MSTRIVTDSNGRKHITNEPQLHGPQRPWVGLTDEERDELYAAHHDSCGYPITATGYEKAIEAKLKEKNT